jgi:hypothetical protein
MGNDRSFSRGKAIGHEDVGLRINACMLLPACLRSVYEGYSKHASFSRNYCNNAFHLNYLHLGMALVKNRSLQQDQNQTSETAWFF